MMKRSCLFAGSSFQKIDPMGISNWSVTYVDWSKRRRYPKTYRAHEISLEFMNSVSVCFDNAESLQKWSHVVASYSTFVVSRLCSPRKWVCTSQVWERYALATFSLSLSLYLYFYSWFWSMESCIGLVHGTGLHGLVICLQGSFILMLSTHWSTSSQTTQAQLSEIGFLSRKFLT